MQKKEPWYIRLALNMGVDPFSKKGRNAIAGSSKRSRATTKPKHWRQNRKVRMVMARQSRRINRDK